MPLQTGAIQIGFRITVSVGESMLGWLKPIQSGGDDPHKYHLRRFWVVEGRVLGVYSQCSTSIGQGLCYLLEAADLRRHISLCPTGGEPVKSSLDEGVGNLELKLIDQACADGVGAALPTVLSFEKTLKGPDDEAWLSLNYSAD